MPSPRGNARLLMAAFLILLLTSCLPPESHQFAIYLLADDLTAEELLQANLDDLTLHEQPIISIDDIFTYWAETHEIELTAAAYRRVQELYTLPVDTDGIPFAVCVGRDPIYVGAFWTPLSSLSFDGVVIMQPFSPTEHSIHIVRGYPGPDFVTGPDPRPDPRLMQALREAGKLKEGGPGPSPGRRMVFALRVDPQGVPLS